MSQRGKGTEGEPGVPRRPRCVLLFGGAFDPPHNGHIYLLKNAIDTLQPDLAVVMPTGTSPHKPTGGTPALVRFLMCGCFRSVDARVRVSGYEIVRRGKSYTIHTVEMLRRRYPQAEIVLSMGSDMLLHFDRWNRWRELLGEVTLFGQCREGDDAAALEAKADELRALGGRVRLCTAPALELSSTQVRAAAAEHGPLGGLVPAPVARIIRLLRLYRAALPSAATCRRAARQNLGDKRYQHTLNVCRQAVHLAKLYGVDPRRAETAALLHDCMKETSESQMLQIFADNGIIKSTIAQRNPAVWHGACAALVARSRLGVRDEGVLSAIDCHTCGKAGMSALDKVIYLADMTSSERHFEGVDTLRALCEKDLDAAMIWALHHTIDYLHSQGKAVDGESLAALRDLEAQKGATDEPSQ